MPPSLVGSRYQLEHPLGQGGLSVVWRGNDLRLDRPVAVKLLTPAALADPTMRQRFDREARTIARLTHPNIVGVYDVGLDGEVPYLVLELVEGQALAEVLAGGPMPVHRALDVAAQACHALAAAHAAGVVHRDIKPANLLLAPNGTVKVCDFGIAHLPHGAAQATLTAVGTIIGTSQYMAPEQVSGEPVDARTDVYAVGCLLYAMLAGSPPFTGDPIDVAHQQLHELPPPLHQRRTDIAPEVSALVHQLLAKSPAERPASAKEVGDRLRALTGHAFAAAPPMPPPAATRSAPAPMQATPSMPATTIMPRPDPAATFMPGPDPAGSAGTSGRDASDRWLRGLLIAGGVLFAVLLVVLAMMLSGGAKAPTAGNSPATTPPAAEAAPEPTTSTQPPTSPTAANPPRAARPGEIIARMRDSLLRLVREGHLQKDAARDLDKRLKEASRALAEGDSEKAWNKLREVAEKVGKLRDEGKLDDIGYARLTAPLAQLAQALPPP